MTLSKFMGAAVLTLVLSACTTTPDPNPGDGTAPTNTGSMTEPSTGGNSSTNSGTSSSTSSSGAGSSGNNASNNSGTTSGSNSGASSSGSGSQSGTVIFNPPSNPTNPGVPSVSVSQAFQNVNGWASADFKNALISFQRGCSALAEKDPNANMHESRSEFGRISDWTATCNVAQATPALDSETARRFFESEFMPVDITPSTTKEGLLTGYYQPEISVRRFADAVYSEPILQTPSSASALNLPRSQINGQTSRVIAYGKPIDVFFMQVQGSGVLVFDTGERLRAAYDANNGRPYTSIGRVLIDRGELTKDQASKQSIEDWMMRAGPAAARALMNENSRYIFFREEQIFPGEGPKGAMRVPLTDMASVAVDPSHNPYGLPIWIETTLPQYDGDYRGTAQQLLVIAQDTGKAIRGQFRADLYFGSGDYAGARAGVMKHPARWTILLPFNLALQWIPVS